MCLIIAIFFEDISTKFAMFYKHTFTSAEHLISVLSHCLTTIVTGQVYTTLSIGAAYTAEFGQTLTTHGWIVMIQRMHSTVDVNELGGYGFRIGEGAGIVVFQLQRVQVIFVFFTVRPEELNFFRLPIVFVPVAESPAGAVFRPMAAGEAF